MIKTFKTILPIFLFSISILFSIDSNAAKFYAIDSHKWSAPGTWDQNAVPTASDTVYINGFEVTVDGSYQVKAIFISNLSNLGPTSLSIRNPLTILGDLVVTSENQPQDVDVYIFASGVLTVNGNVTFTRTADNITSNRLHLNMYGSTQMYVLGDFTFDYKNSLVTTPIANSEISTDIILSGSALLDVTGQTSLIARDGKDLDFILELNAQAILRDSLSILMYNGQQASITAKQSSHFQLLGNAYIMNSGGSTQTLLKAENGGKMTLSGNVYMESTVSNKIVKLETDGIGSEMNVNGDIIMTAVSDSSVEVYLTNDGTLNLGGQILRPTNYGALVMNTDGELVFNGTQPQTFPEGKLVNSGTDSLYFGNISIENTSSSPFELTSDLIIQDTLVLTSGNIKTSSSALLILENNASIKGGDANSYIEGPVLKKGALQDIPFTLPVGDAGNYAPITITPESNNTSAEYNVQYYSDPPPFGVIHNISIDNMNGSEYWELSKSSGSPDADVTLSWNDAAAQGISDVNDLVVAGYDQANSEWTSYGNGGTTTDPDGSGTVSSLASDPPPFGVIFFTIGSTSNKNALPVELTSFQAIQQNSYAYLQWETASERNTSHFSIEKSINGFDFKEIGRTQGSGDGVVAQQYSFKDITPENGINYYRLKIVDHDNTFEYSNIEVINFETAPAIQLFPNPIEKTIQLEGFDSDLKDVQLEIFDQNGKLIFSNKVSIDDGRLQISTDLANVHNSGTYYLRIIGQGKNHVLKFIKIN